MRKTTDTVMNAAHIVSRACKDGSEGTLVLRQYCSLGDQRNRGYFWALSGTFCDALGQAYTNDLLVENRKPCPCKHAPTRYCGFGIILR